MRSASRRRRFLLKKNLNLSTMDRADFVPTNVVVYTRMANQIWLTCALSILQRRRKGCAIYYTACALLYVLSFSVGTAKRWTSPWITFLRPINSTCIYRGIVEQGKMALISGEQRPNLERNRGTKTTLGNREHEKRNFRFWGTDPIYFRGTREQAPPPPTPRRASFLQWTQNNLLILILHHMAYRP